MFLPVAIKANLESRLAMASSSAILVEFFKRAHKDKLQTMKLVYYAQAHHLIFFERPLFVNDLQAWELGPVPLAAYRSWNDPPSVPLSPDLTLFLTLLLRWFPHSGSVLVDQTHAESPWVVAWSMHVERYQGEAAVKALCSCASGAHRDPSRLPRRSAASDFTLNRLAGRHECEHLTVH